jgi:hypothetical protein
MPRENYMRSLLLACATLLAFAALMIFETGPASAAVCANGVYRAGCAGPRGAVVVRKPVAVCRTVWVNGVRVRRCY